MRSMNPFRPVSIGAIEKQDREVDVVLVTDPLAILTGAKLATVTVTFNLN